MVIAATFSLLTFSSAALWASPASAATLDDVTLTVSNNATSATPVTYTWNVTTKTAGALTSLTFGVPGATDAPTLPDTLTTGTAYGPTGCTTSTPTLASGIVTLPLAGCPVIAASTPVSVAITGFTNTTAPDSGFTTTVTTSAVKLTVATNARDGYVLTSCVTPANVIQDAASPVPVIPQLSSPGVPNGTTTALGAQAAFQANTGTGTAGVGIAALQGAWATATGSSYVGYASDCDPAGTAANAKVIANSGTTNGDEVTLTNAVSADSVHPNGTYSGVITYQVAPNY